ncbi:sulfotransferase family protein [Roseisalinus antarcticus]|uniref:Sulfotransferase family protein n=1 Tax=Roseisalinus antarcticus TaxID=254357 RepID=A0A1Y5RHX8_9RHOB|nr:sulfotransferase family protein [Roseisalinus antarcticus]SLN17537.1 hypothetical protein ROA7023_00315 [Roseisalinus antarcticus]
MTLKVIGSGFGRTGTMTMKDALGTLGFGPSHHMTEIIDHPEQLTHWKAVFAGQEVDWAEVYAGYNSQVDWPGAYVWHEASIAFPEARVIHTERPEEDWWASFSGTIGKFFSHADTMPLPPHLADLFRTMKGKGSWLEQTFTDHTDRAAAIAAYRANNKRVRELIPADRLLIFNVAEGWGPLCGFLGVDVPDTRFPHHNERREFWDLLGGEPETA